MKNLTVSLFATLLLLVAFSVCARAQDGSPVPQSWPMFDVQHRLSVGARFYRSFDEKLGTAGSYTSNWWAGIPASYVITGRLNPDGSRNPLPLSVIGSADIGLNGPYKQHLRGYVGVMVLLKGLD